MSVTVVGSIAFDAVETPFGERERMLGGSAVHFALAASFFGPVRVVGPVGEDFGPTETAVLRDRGIETDDIEHVAGGRTFFWKGVYGWDLNDRETLDTQLNVFAEFEPKLSDASRACDVLFLANIQPDLQRQVREQCRQARFVALDSMNLWIDTARESLTTVLGMVDCVILNDAEIRQLTGESNLLRAARKLLEIGPSVVVCKQGEYGAALITADGFFSLPAFPLEDVIDPTGAGDTFAGGFVGYMAAHLDEWLAARDGAATPGYEDSLRAASAHEDVLSAAPGRESVLRAAMAYGTAIASYNVQEFGTERVARLDDDEIEQRVRTLAAITRPAPTADTLGAR